MKKTILIFEKVRAYAYSNKLSYEFSFQPESLMFRIQGWGEIKDTNFINFLVSLGFYIDIDNGDEDRLPMFSYIFKETKKKILYDARTISGNDVIVWLHRVPELDEQHGDDIIMIDSNGVEYPTQSLKYIKEIK